MNEKPNQKKFKEGFQPEESGDRAPAAAAPPPQPPPLAVPDEQWPIVVKLLHKPVRNSNNEEVSELSFREPRGADINRYGNPVRIDQNGDVVIDERKMSMIMSGLSGVLLPFLEQMDPRDWNSCAYRLRSFFLPDPRAWE